MLEAAGIEWRLLEVLGLVEEDEEESDDPAAWTRVIPVSMDCIFSGPGKSTQVESWTWWEIGTSSPIKGLVVGLMALIATLLLLRALKGVTQDSASSDVRTFARLQVIALAAEVAALGYFAWRALLDYFFELPLEWYVLAGISLAVTAVIFVWLARRMYRLKCEEAQAELKAAAQAG